MSITLNKNSSSYIKIDAVVAKAAELLEKAKWSKAYIDKLPDSAFLYIESGGKKDDDGKTVPRSLRHFPVRDVNGKLDLPHLRNALSRIPQSKLPAAVRDKLRSKAQRLLAQSTEKSASDIIDKARRMAGNKKPYGAGAAYKDDMTSASLSSGGKLQGGNANPLPKKPKGLKPTVNDVVVTNDQHLSIISQASKTLQKVMTTEVKLTKADLSTNDERYVLGIVLEPETKDSQDDIYDAETIRKTAHDFMQYYQTIGLQHQGSVDDRIKILESYLAPCDFEIGGQPVKKGTWLLGARVVDDGLWTDVKDGKLTGWSIGGTAISTPELSD